MMNTRNLAVGALAFVVGALSASAAAAYDWSVTAHVTMVEASYTPTRIVFSVDQAGGTCAAGALLGWNSSGSDSTQLSANGSAILSLLMTAKVSGQPITIFGSNSGCTISFIHLGTV